MTDITTKTNHATDQASDSPLAKIDPKLVENVSVTLEAFLGRAQVSVGELTALQQGSLVRLDAPLSQAVELRLNGLAVARGELVAAGDSFAVRIIEIAR